MICIICMHFTFFSACDKKRRRERRDSTPQTSLFLSLNKTAVAMHIAGWCCTPALYWLRQSLYDTIEVISHSKRGAFSSTCRSAISISHLNSINSDMVCLQKRDGDFLLHRMLQSVLTQAGEWLHIDQSSQKLPLLLLGCAPPARALCLWVIQLSNPWGWMRWCGYCIL